MPGELRPVIFVSATSRDLSSCRQRIKDSLLTLGCVPEEQRNFPPNAGSVRKMLRARLKTCQAVIHVAGEVYGSEPTERSPGEPRRSYTQLEVDIARQLGVPVYVFVCGNGFPYDPHEPEAEELRELQRAHRRALVSGDALYEAVANGDALEKRVLTLQDRVDVLRGELERSRRHLAVGISLAAAALVALGISVYLVSDQAARINRELSQQRAELDQQRAELDQQRAERDKEREFMRLIATTCTRLQSELKDLKLSSEQLLSRAIDSVAEHIGVDPATLHTAIQRFVGAIRADEDAGSLDRALAYFMEGNFSAAASIASETTVRPPDEQRPANDETSVGTAYGEERAVLTLKGQAMAASDDLEGSIAAFEAALAMTPRDENPQSWADLQSEIGACELALARRADGTDIGEHQRRSVAAYRAALEVYTQAQFPQDWAMTQNNLAIALGDQASVADGAARAGLLTEAVAACRAALQVYTRDALPQGWAMTQYNLANALRRQASAATGAERAMLLAEAVTAYRAALEIRTRDVLPRGWAVMMYNLADALSDQASASRGTDRARLLVDAVIVFGAALDVFARDGLPQDWAATRDNLRRALSELVLKERDTLTPELLMKALEAGRRLAGLDARESDPNRSGTPRP